MSKFSISDYPRVTVGPENPIRVERDDTAELFCQVDSKPPVEEVRWVRDIRFVQTQFRHLIPRANLKDEGIYICNADNGLGQVKYEVAFSWAKCPRTLTSSLIVFGLFVFIVYFSIK